jgi:hypothetical protein
MVSAMNDTRFRRLFRVIGDLVVLPDGHHRGLPRPNARDPRAKLRYPDTPLGQAHRHIDEVMGWTPWQRRAARRAERRKKLLEMTPAIIAFVATVVAIMTVYQTYQSYFIHRDPVYQKALETCWGLSTKPEYVALTQDQLQSLQGECIDGYADRVKQSLRVLHGLDYDVEYGTTYAMGRLYYYGRYGILIVFGVIGLAIARFNVNGVFGVQPFHLPEWHTTISLTCFFVGFIGVAAMVTELLK